MRNRLLPLLFAATLLAPFGLLPGAMGAPAPSGQASPSSSSAPPEIRMEVDGQPLTFPTSKPTLNGTRVFVPLRRVLEAMGATSVWNPATHTMESRKGNRRLVMDLPRRTVTVDGRSVRADFAVQPNGEIIVPLQFFADTLGAGATWNPTTRSIGMTTSASTPTSSAPDSVASKTQSAPPATNSPASAPTAPKTPGGMKGSEAATSSHKSPANSQAKGTGSSNKPFLQEYQEPKKEGQLDLGKVLMDIFVKLALLLGIAYVALYVLRAFMNRTGTLPGRKGHLKVMESVALGPNRAVHLVKVGGKILVIGSTQEQITTLGELEDAGLKAELIRELPTGSFNTHLSDAIGHEEPEALNDNVQDGIRHLWGRVQEIRGLGEEKRKR